MKKLILFLLVVPCFLQAQNVGIGISNPMQKLHVGGGNFLITQPLSQTNSLPSPGQTYTMLNGAVLVYPATDSTGKVYDPGGAAGNYLANLAAYISVPPVANCIGFEVTINSIGLGTGDSLIFSEFPGSQNVQLAVGNNYSSTGTYIFSVSRLYITFKSNTDGSVGGGFDVSFKRKFDAVAAIPITNQAGNVFAFDAKYARLQLGTFKNNESLGQHSISAGTSKALADFSLAIGDNNEVYGDNSFSLGSNNKVYGASAGAAGFNNVIDGDASFVFGRNNDFYTGAFASPVFVVGENCGPANLDIDPLLVVGNGVGTGGKGNALEVYRSGKTAINGWAQLGKASEGAPMIKTKKISGTMPAIDNSWVFIPAGLSNMNKILSFQVIVTNGIYQFIPNTTHPGSYFRTNVDGPNIAVGTFSGQSSFLYGMPIKIFITYEE